MSTNNDDFVARFGRDLSGGIRKGWPILLAVVVAVVVALGAWCAVRADLMPGAVGGVAVAVAFCTVVALCGRPWDRTGIEKGIERSGLKNHAGEPPIYVAGDFDGRHITLLLDTVGIDFGTFLAKKAELEAGMDVHISEIRPRGLQHVEIDAVPGDVEIPDEIEWSDDYLRPDDFEIVLGEGLGRVVINVSDNAHTLVAGETGSGKTVMIKNYAYQCASKGAHLTILDGKDLLDYQHPFWREHGTLAQGSPRIGYKEISDLLGSLEIEMLKRSDKFKATGCASISEYNRFIQDKPYLVPMQREIIVCDEVATILDGKDPDQKAIKAKLEQIAMLGRAYGMHLLLGTQRPDAQILSGQIRSNIGTRLCGRADRNLRSVVFDYGAGYDVPTDSFRPGRFVDQNGREFQGFRQDI